MSDLDLDAIKGRHKGRSYYEHWGCCQDLSTLLAEVERLRAEKALLGDALVGMVVQHTYQREEGNWQEFHHSFMSADERAFQVLVDTGFADFIDDGYSIRLRED